MIPVGPERDKMIAELKGIVSCDKYKHFHGNGFVKGNCDHDNCMPDFYYPRKYSTDTTWAMKLLPDHFEITVFKSDTLGFCACVTFYKEGPSWSGIRTKLAIFESDYKSKKEWAIADAISGAWLKGAQK